MARVQLADTEARVFIGLLAAANVGVSLAYFDPGYFTWWSWNVFLFFLLMVSADVLRTNVAWFCFFNALFVTIGVLSVSRHAEPSRLLVHPPAAPPCLLTRAPAAAAMAAMRSSDNNDLLSTTARESGLLGYGLQTYAVHYLPTTVVAIISPVPKRDNLEEVTGALLCAITFFTGYLSFNNPTEVYGVTMTPEMSFGMAAGFAAVVVAGLWAAGYR